jgi:hypothetical protein
MITKGLLGIVGVMALALFYYYMANQALKGDLQTALIKTEAAETSLRTAKVEKALFETQIEQFAAKQIEIENERNEARLEVDKMRDLFQDHDFAKLLSRKPGLVENLMIKKTEAVFDEIEALTAP